MDLNTYVRQEAWFAIHPADADQKVQNNFQVLWPAVCKGGPHILHLRPGQLIAVLKIAHKRDTSGMPAYLGLELKEEWSLYCRFCLSLPGWYQHQFLMWLFFPTSKLCSHDKHRPHYLRCHVHEIVQHHGGGLRGPPAFSSQPAPAGHHELSVFQGVIFIFVLPPP